MSMRKRLGMALFVSYRFCLRTRGLMCHLALVALGDIHPISVRKTGRTTMTKLNNRAQLKRSVAAMFALLIVSSPQLVMAASEPEAAGGGHAEGGGIASRLLGPELGTAVWTIVLFALLLAVLGKFVWPHILKGLKDREDRIRYDLEQAEQQREEAGQTLQQYKSQLAEARKEAQQLIEQSRSDAQKVAEDLKAQAQNDIQQMRDRAQREINAAREEAVAEVYERTAEIATHIAGRILRREISADDQKDLVEASLNELARTEQAAAPSVSGQA